MATGILEDNLRPLPSDVWRTNGGIYLGLTPVGGTDQRRPLKGQEDEPRISRAYDIRTTMQPDGKHHLFQAEGNVVSIGPQGVGKTRKLFYPNLFKLQDWSICVIDVKGELTAHTAVARSRRKGHKVYVIDPFGVIKENYPSLYARHPELFESHGFNPVAALKPGPRLNGDAKALARALITTEGTKEIHFPQGAQALAKGLIMAMRLSTPGKSDNLAVLRNAIGLSGSDLAKFTGRQQHKFGKQHAGIRNSLNDFVRYSSDDRELNGIRRTANIQTDWLDDERIQRDLTRNKPIDFASFKDRPQTCYFVLPPGELEEFGIWLRLMIAGAIRPMMGSVERAKVPVLFMLDEMAQLGRMDIIARNMAQMRGFGLKLWTAWQDLSQMRAVYGDDWEGFMSLADAKITFGINHAETREYFSRLSGERLYKHSMRNYSRSTTSGSSTPTMPTRDRPFQWLVGDSTNKSESESYSSNETFQSERVIKPYELAALNADEAIIFGPGGKMWRSITPQPEMLPGVGKCIAAARMEIEAPYSAGQRLHQAQADIAAAGKEVAAKLHPEAPAQ